MLMATYAHKPKASAGLAVPGRTRCRIAALVLTTLLVVPAHAAVTLKIATISPDGTSWMRHMREAAKEIAVRSDNRVRFKFYPGGIMGNDMSVLRKMRIGQLQGGAVAGGSLASISPDNLLYGLPFLFRSADEVSHVRRAMDPFLIEAMESKGLVSFGLAEAGFAYLMSRVPVRTLEVLRAQKVWVPSTDPISREAMERAQMSPIPLPLPDVMTALQTGLINTVTTSPIAAIALQWHTRVRYVTDTPLTYIYATLVVDQRAFSKISASDQKIVREVMGATFHRIDVQNRLDNNRARVALSAQGIEFVQFQPETLRQIREVASEVRRDFTSSAQFRPDLVETMTRLLDEYRSQEQKTTAWLSR